MPWTTLLKLNEPFYPKSEGPGRPAKPLFFASTLLSQSDVEGPRDTSIQ